MARGLEWVDAARADAHVHVADPIVAVGFLQIGGGFDDALLAELAPDAS